jgi:hypothetical protein
MELYLLQVLYCIYCIVFFCCTYGTVLTVLYCSYYTCLYSIHSTTVIDAQYNIFAFFKEKKKKVLNMPILSQTLKGPNSETGRPFELQFFVEMYFD